MFVLDGGPITGPEPTGSPRARHKFCRSDGVWMLMWLLMQYCFSGIYMDVGWLLWSHYRNLFPLSSPSVDVCEWDILSCLICIREQSQRAIVVCTSACLHVRPRSSPRCYGSNPYTSPSYLRALAVRTPFPCLLTALPSFLALAAVVWSV